MAQLIDWEALEDKYCTLYGEGNSTSTKPVWLAILAMLIKQIENLPDEKLVLHIVSYRLPHRARRIQGLAHKAFGTEY